MAMIGTRDKPSHYRIVTANGDTVAVAPKSKVLSLRAKLQKERGEKLELELIDYGAGDD